VAEETDFGLPELDPTDRHVIGLEYWHASRTLPADLLRPPQLLVVVGADQLTGRSTTSPLAGHRFVVPTNAHTSRR